MKLELRSVDVVCAIANRKHEWEESMEKIQKKYDRSDACAELLERCSLMINEYNTLLDIISNLIEEK